MRVCYFGTYRASYIRNQLMIDRLRHAGIEVVECHVDLWGNFERREKIARGGWINLSFWIRTFVTYLRLISKFIQTAKIDFVIIGYPGALDVIIARILCWIRRKRLIWDVYMSVYLIALEREIDRQNSVSARLMRIIESIACHLADWIIIDTPEYAQWLRENYNVSTDRIFLAPAGADDRIFFPHPDNCYPHDHFICLYYGSYIKNHGVETIVEAAKILQDDRQVQFQLIGDGPFKPKIEQLVSKYRLTNINLIEWQDTQSLLRFIAGADICLGSFGNTPQALMTVQNKINECLAMKKALISGDSLTMRRYFTHLENIYICEREHPSSLASAIKSLRYDPVLRQKIAENGLERFNELFSIEVTSKHLAAWINSL